MGVNLRILRGHTSYIYPVAYSPDGRWFASGGWDNVVRLWDAASGEPIAVLGGMQGFVASLAISPDGARLVARSYDGTMRVWDTTSGLLRFKSDGGIVHLPVDKDGVLDFLPQNVAISPDGALIACGYNDRIRFWELATGNERESLRLPVTGAIRHVVFGPEGRRLALAATNPAISLVELGAVPSLKPLMAGDMKGPGDLKSAVFAIAFSPDGRTLVSTGDDRIVRIWDVQSGKLQRELHGHSDQVFAVAFHPDGNRLATAGREPDIHIWDLASGEDVARLRGHNDYVFSLAFSPDGSTLISGSGESTVRIWETNSLAQRRAAGEELRRLRPEADALVGKLFMQGLSALDVVQHLRKDSSLGETLERAAWHAVLRRTTTSPPSR
jgi:WD40 repeat protein